MTGNAAAQEKFSITVKKALLDRDMTMGQLATLVGKRRETVSRALHTRHNAKTARRIREVLGLKG